VILALANQGSGKMLGIASGGLAVGAQAVQWTNTGVTDEQWTLAVSGSYYTIQNANSTLDLGIQSGSTANGAYAVQWTADGSLNQQWKLVQVSGD